MRDIVFLQTNPDCNAQYVCGNAVREGLKKVGIDSKIAYLDSIRSIKDSLVFIFKIPLKDSEYEILKRNNNKIVMDVIDEFIRPSTDVLDIYNYSHFDGIILRVNKVQEEYTFPSHLNIAYIPHHWDRRLEGHSVDHKNRNYTPVCVSNDLRDVLYISHLYTTKKVDFITDVNFDNFTNVINRVLKYTVHYNVRSVDSPAYKFKPATKLVTAAALDAPLITNYDWALQNLIPEDYPFLVKDTSLRNIITFVTNIDNIEESQWRYASKILKDVKERTRLDNLIPEYINYYKQF